MANFKPQGATNSNMLAQNASFYINLNQPKPLCDIIISIAPLRENNKLLLLKRTKIQNFLFWKKE